MKIFKPLFAVTIVVVSFLPFTKGRIESFAATRPVLVENQGMYMIATDMIYFRPDLLVPDLPVQKGGPCNRR